MVDTYRIYLANESKSAQMFWCFLAEPDALRNNPNVFANSAAALTVPPASGGLSGFFIPAQYVVAAGAGNQAVAWGARIVPGVSDDASLTQTWDAQYATVPPNVGPELSLSGTPGSPNTIAIATNAFDIVGNENAGWFANQSYGIDTNVGFAGMTWSPVPLQTVSLTPKLGFYVTIGSYGSNQLASWADVSSNSALASVPDDFQDNQCTVTYRSDGSWTVTPGRSQSFQPAADAAAMPGSGSDFPSTQAVKLTSVSWDSSSARERCLMGNAIVATALTAPFSHFIISALYFTVQSVTAGGTRVAFAYDGLESVDRVRSLFQPGAELAFRQ